MSGVKEAGTVSVLRAIIKSDATVTTGKINLKNVCSSYGTTETEKVNKTITVNIEAQEPEKSENITPPEDNNNSDNGSTEQKQPEKENKPVAPAQTTNKNNPTTTKLPKAGLSSGVAVAIIVVIIGIIIGYIKYKKMC